MNRVEAAFERLRTAGKRGIVPFVCGGHPTLGVLPAILGALDRSGAPVIEIGIPFSDPIADGPVIASAMHAALSADPPVTPGRVMEAVAAARGGVRAGIVAMVSMSIVFKAGPERFVADAAAAGFDGFIFPDCPPEEAGDLLGLCRGAGLTATLLVAPTTPPGRAGEIARMCTGMVYLLARSGTTGERAEVPADLGRRVAEVRAATELPIACGFGIATAAGVREVVRHADAVVVGSALVRRLGEAHAAGRDPAVAAAELMAEISGGLPSGEGGVGALGEKETSD